MKQTTKFIIMMSLTPLMFACGSKSDKQASKDFSVKTCKAEAVENRLQQDFTFISKPYRTSELSFRISGPILSFDVYSGNRYAKGSVIAQIDPRDFAIRKERAEAVYGQCKAEFERIGVLYQKNNISASLYEKAKADYVSAKTAFETASNELSDTKLVAPFSGYIGSVYIEQYQEVRASQPVVSLVDLSRLKIETYVTQNIAFNTKKGQTIELKFDAMPDKVYQAQVEQVSKSTTDNNLSYLLTAILPNPDSKLLAGMSGTIRFAGAELSAQAAGTKSIVIPQAALCYRPSQGNYVWVVDPQSSQVMRRNVTAGQLLNSGIEIRQGLAEGETIACSGLRFLSDSLKVTVSAN